MIAAVRQPNASGRMIDLTNNGGGDTIAITHSGSGNNAIDIVYTGNQDVIKVVTSLTGGAALRVFNNTSVGAAIDINLGDATQNRALYVSDSNYARTAPMCRFVRQPLASGTVLEVSNYGTGYSQYIQHLGTGRGIHVSLENGKTTSSGIGVQDNDTASRSGNLLYLSRASNATGDAVELTNYGSGYGFDLQQRGTNTGLRVRCEATAANRAVLINEDNYARASSLIQIVRTNNSTGVVIEVLNFGQGHGLYLQKNAGSARTGNCLNIYHNANCSQSAAYIYNLGTGVAALEVSHGGTGNAIDVNMFGANGYALELDYATNYAHMHLIGRTSDPSVLTDGAVWWNTTDNRLRVRDGATTRDIAWMTDVSGSGTTLDGAYDFGGAGIGRTITVDANAVVLNNAAADNFNVLEINKTPAGTQSGGGLYVTMGVNTTGNGVSILQGGISHGVSCSITGGASGTGGTAFYATVQGGTTSMGLQIGENTSYARTNALAYLNRSNVSSSGDVLDISNSGTGDGIDINQTGAGAGIFVQSSNGVGVSIDMQNASTAFGLELDYGTSSGVAFDVRYGGTNYLGRLRLDGSDTGAGGLNIQESSLARTGYLARITRVAAAVGNALEIYNNATASSRSLYINHLSDAGAIYIQNAGGAAAFQTYMNGTDALAHVLRGTEDASVDRTSSMVYLQRNAGSSGNVIEVANSGSGYGLDFSGVTTGGKADVHFTSRTANPGTPVGGDVWYVGGSVNKLRYYDGTSVQDLPGSAGGANTLDAAYDQGGAGVGRSITVDSGAVQLAALSGGTANLALDVNDGGIDIDTGAGGISALNIVHRSSDKGINLTMVGSGAGIVMADAVGATGRQVTLTRYGTNTADQIYLDKRGLSGSVAGSALRIYYDANTSGNCIDVASSSSGDAIYVNNSGSGAGFYLSNGASASNGIEVGQSTTGNAIDVSQTGSGNAVDVSQTGSGSAFVAACSSAGQYGLFFRSASAGRSDIHFSNRTSTPPTVAEGDLWYRSDINRLYCDAGSNRAIAWTTDITADTQNTLNEAYNEGGAGSGRSITVNSGAVDLNQSGTTNCLEIAQTGIGSGIYISCSSSAQYGITFSNFGNYADIRLYNRSGNPAGLTEGAFWYNGSANRLSYSDGTTRQIAHTGDLHSQLHASTHIDGGADAIDGDRLEITWGPPTNYTPSTTPAEADSTDDLTAHLYGIDQALAGGGGTLDDAYDFGGAGSGRKITADSGAVEITSNVNNTTAALQINRDPLNQAARGIYLNMGDFGVPAGSTAAAIEVDNGGAQAALRVDQTGGNSRVIDINLLATTGTALRVQDNGTDIGWNMVELSRTGGIGDVLDINISTGSGAKGVLIDNDGNDNAIDINQSGSGDAINIYLDSSASAQALVIDESSKARTAALVYVESNSTSGGATAHFVKENGTGNLMFLQNNETSSGGHCLRIDNLSAATSGAECIEINHSGRSICMDININSSINSAVILDVDTAGSGDVLNVNGSVMRITSKGRTIVNAPAETGSVVQSISGGSYNNTSCYIKSNHTTYTNNVLEVICNRTHTDLYDLAEFQSGGSSDREFRFTGAGKGYADGGWLGTASDYAEYIEVPRDPSNYEAGDVMVINSDDEFETSASSNSPLIAGVYSTDPVVVGNTTYLNFDLSTGTVESSAWRMTKSNPNANPDEEGEFDQLVIEGDRSTDYAVDSLVLLSKTEMRVTAVSYDSGDDETTVTVDETFAVDLYNDPDISTPTIKHGMTLRDCIPMAMLGRVPCKCITENGSIAPGDLLVTSSTTGHAMKAGASPAVGTILGKSLGTITDTDGTQTDSIMVYVNLM